jgi:(Z)-2-((N-methylformamido)methylene)-5-hydroxybutyrolactone dehydrogenase
MAIATHTLEAVRPYQMYINGQWVDGATGTQIESIDPYLNAAWARFPRANETDVERAVNAAQEAFQGPWRRMSGADRRRLLLRLATLLEERGEEIAQLEVRDNGKILREMSAQLKDLPEWYYYWAGAADKRVGQSIASSKTNYLIYTLDQPIGVAALLTAWNSPMLLLAYKLGPALAAGCTVVVKPSHSASISTLAFTHLVEEAGFPPGVFNVITGYGSEVGSALVAHPGVAKIAFTGSTETGIEVLRAAAGRVGRVTLELGGKAPNVVFADANLDAAANGVVAGIFAAAGQSCVAGSRLIVHESVHDALVAEVVERARRIQLGDPMDLATEMGPMASREQAAKALRYIEIARSEGATVATGGEAPAAMGESLFVEPTVLTGVKNAMTVAQEEIFGPVLSVIRFRSDDEAVAIANDTRYGLAAGIWTEDMRRAHRVAAEIDAGTVWVNDYRVENFDVPFGGFKQSGIGRENGIDAIGEYLERKAVWVELEGRLREPFRLG